MKYILSEEKGKISGERIIIDCDDLKNGVEGMFPGSTVLTIYDKAPQPASDYSGYAYSVTMIDDNGERKETVYRVWLKKNKIKSLISSTGLTQAAFAEKFHIPKRTVEDWAAGRRTPPDYVPYLIELAIKAEG